MTYVITDKQNYEDIADAIRAKNGSQSTYTPSQMATAISNISGSKIPIISANNLFNNGSNWPFYDRFDFTTGSLTNCNSAFRVCFVSGKVQVSTLDLTDWNVSHVSDFSSMFQDCSYLQSLNLSGWNLSSGAFFSSMFSNCSGLTSLNLTGWVNSNVESFSNIFNGCSSLSSLDISGLCPRSTGNVAAYNTFKGMRLNTLDISGIDASKISSNAFRNDNSNMFYDCVVSGTAYCRSAADKTILDQAVANAGQSWTFTVKE